MYDDAGLEAFVTNRIKEVFALCGMTAYKFSVITGIPRTTINDYLYGKVHPSIYFIGVCCNYFGLTQDDFYKTYDTRNAGLQLADILATSTETGKIQQLYALRILESINKKLEVLTIKEDLLN